jgi:ribosomal protein S18 acetylase RimI-like enzyme
MEQKIKRYFLELKNKNIKNLSPKISESFKITLDIEKNFNVNKFFYKQIGIDHYWRDRLVWSDKEWTKYVCNSNLETWILRNGSNLVGFYEQEYHYQTNEVELINMGVLKEHRGNNLGSTLLRHVISSAYKKKIKRIWVHTCSLDHKYALQNYKSRGFKIFKEEEIDFAV